MRPVTAGTFRVPHEPGEARPQTASSVASFRSVQARPTLQPSQMVGMPPNMDGSNWVQPNRPKSAKNMQDTTRARSAQRQRSARSSRSFETRESAGKADPESLRMPEELKAQPEQWLTGGEDDSKPKWWNKANAAKVNGAAANDGKVKVLQKFNPDGTTPNRGERRRLAKKDEVQVFVHEHQREIVEYFQSGYLQMTLPTTTSRIRKALGVRPAVRRLMSLLCCGVLALGVYAIVLTVQLNNAFEDIATAEAAAGTGGGGAQGQTDDTVPVRASATGVSLTRAVIPYDQFARVCRCVHRPPGSYDTHVTRFEAVVDHIYGDAMAAVEGRSQLVAGLTIYDVSAPWSPTSPSSVGGGAGYCEADPTRMANHNCDDQLGVEFGSSAKLLWQWSPFRTGEGIPASDSTNFRFPTAAGLRLEAGKPYSFVIQVDYDMGYFYGQEGGGGGGTVS